MIPEDTRKLLKKQHYEVVGEHSAVQICRYTKKSIRDETACYKEKFYGIKSHRCCQMTPAVMWCPNKCLHCWRAIEKTIGEKLSEEISELDSPKKIIDGCINAQKKLLTGFKSNKKTNKKKLKEAQEPNQFAISLSGEPTVYPIIGELISELRKRGKTSFLVTNGLYPEKLKELKENCQLPTQLYVSVNTPNKKLYERFHRSVKPDAWEKLNETLELIKKLSCRTVVRINLVKNLNIIEPENYSKLISKAKPMFIELKGYMSVGFARQRLGYEMMPWHEDIKDFAKNLIRELKKLGLNYKILDEHEFARAIVLGKNKGDLKIKKEEI